MDEERLVADVEGGGVGGNGLAHDVRPGVDEALLKKGRLEALIPEVLEDNVLDGDGITFEQFCLKFTVYGLQFTDDYLQGERIHRRR